MFIIYFQSFVLSLCLSDTEFFWWNRLQTLYIVFSHSDLRLRVNPPSTLLDPFTTTPVLNFLRSFKYSIWDQRKTPVHKGPNRRSQRSSRVATRTRHGCCVPSPPTPLVRTVEQTKRRHHKGFFRHFWDALPSPSRLSLSTYILLL